MNSDKEKSPLDDLGDEIGSDTQYRYRYQAMCAAIYSLLLLKTPRQYNELYCEQQDDILLKKNNGKYVAIQVKSRQPTSERFKGTDKQILRTLKKFVELDLKYSDYFDEFLIVTNCGFWEERDNHRNLPNLLSLVKEENADEESLAEKYDIIFREMRSVGPSSISICNILKRVNHSKIADFDAINDRLARAISEMGPPWSEYSLPKLDIIATALTDRMIQAASITSDLEVDVYDSVLGVDEIDIRSRVISQREITSDVVSGILRESIEQVVLLSSLGSINSNQLTTSTDTFQEKMEMGEISMDNRTHLKDQKNSAEVMLIKLRSRRGREQMEGVYQHLGMEVRNEWLELFDQYKRSHSEPFGQELLEALKPRIRALHNTMSAQMKEECTHQHLMGIAGLLTATCPIRWSVSNPGEES